MRGDRFYQRSPRWSPPFPEQYRMGRQLQPAARWAGLAYGQPLGEYQTCGNKRLIFNEGLDTITHLQAGLLAIVNLTWPSTRKKNRRETVSEVLREWWRWMASARGWDNKMEVSDKWSWEEFVIIVWLHTGFPAALFHHLLLSACVWLGIHSSQTQLAMSCNQGRKLTPATEF